MLIHVCEMESLDSDNALQKYEVCLFCSALRFPHVHIEEKGITL